MNVCLVTAFPPSHQALNEYGFHIASELQKIPGISLTILGDDLGPGQHELPDFNVLRCWAFDRLNNASRLLRTIKHLQPDVIWFNLAFASFGGKALPAFMGVSLPAMVRMHGHYTHVTLHQLMETVDLKDAQVRFPIFYRVGGFLATQVLLFSNSVSVLLPAYRDVLRKKYGRGVVYVRKHGILTGKPEYPAFAQRGNPTHRILAFGKWGTYKRLEPMIQAFCIASKKLPNMELLIGGMDHPKAPGYLNSVAEQCRDLHNIKFLGYVPEDAVGPLFQSASVAVMPYTSSAGSSGVAHLACAYGVPMIACDIPDFRQLRDEEGIAIDLFEPVNVDRLAERLVSLLENPVRQREMALQNFSAALRMSMPEIMREYLRSFQLQRNLDGLTSVSKLRRLPRWFPFRSFLMNRAVRKLARVHSTYTPPEDFPLPEDSPVDVERQRGGSVLSGGVAVDGDIEDAIRRVERGTAPSSGAA
jgi:glycosyltransferase involved in cell wall biosynthesis